MTLGLVALLATSACGAEDSGEPAPAGPIASTAAALSQPSTLWTTDYSDAGGWNALVYANTIRLGDVNGDGKADVCGRGSAGVYCSTSSGHGFSPARLWTPPGVFSDADGWANVVYADTLQLGDLNGDGTADICGRSSNGMTCALSTGDSFGPISLWTPDFGDVDHWNWATYYDAIRLGDVNGDGKADVCGRGQPGIFCAISRGNSFAPSTLWAADYSDTSWKLARWSNSFQLGDVDADGKADACLRGLLGMQCSTSNGAAFMQPRYWESGGNPTFTDVNFMDPSAYNTLRLADIDGDGTADVCGRASDGLHCGLSDAVSTFGSGSLWSNELSDASGYGSLVYADTIQLGDVNGDHLADVCARSSDGIRCSISQATRSACGVGANRVSIDALRGASIVVDNGINYAVYGDPLFYVADVTSRSPSAVPVRMFLNGKDLGPGIAFGQGHSRPGGSGDTVTASTPSTMTLAIDTPCGRISKTAPITKVNPTPPVIVLSEDKSSITRGDPVAVEAHWNHRATDCVMAHVHLVGDGLDKTFDASRDLVKATFSPQNTTTVLATLTCDVNPSAYRSTATIGVQVNAPPPPPVCYPQSPGTNKVLVNNQGGRGAYNLFEVDHTAGTTTFVGTLPEHVATVVTLPECHFVSFIATLEGCQPQDSGDCMAGHTDPVVGRTDGSVWSIGY